MNAQHKNLDIPAPRDPQQNHLRRMDYHSYHMEEFALVGGPVHSLCSLLLPNFLLNQSKRRN